MLATIQFRILSPAISMLLKRARARINASLVTQENSVVRRRHQSFNIYTSEHIYFYDRYLASNDIDDRTWGVQKNIRRNPKLLRAHLEYI